MNASLGSIRPEYQRTFDLFEEIACDFGFELSEGNMMDLRKLARAVEMVDRYYDQISDEEQRTLLRNDVYKALNGDEPTNDLMPEVMRTCLLELRQTLVRLDCVDDFLAKIVDIFSYSDIIKETQDVHRLIQYSLTEGSLTGDLALLLIGETRSDFSAFWRDVFSVGNLVDDLVDAVEDFESGEKAFCPNLKFYLNGSLRAMYGLRSIVKAYPQKRSLLKYLRGVFYGLQRYKRYSA